MRSWIESWMINEGYEVAIEAKEWKVVFDAESGDADISCFSDPSVIEESRRSV